ncbi:MAG: hypothetical protein ACFFBS_01790 [Promethearchaeota archaeon]
MSRKKTAAQIVIAAWLIFLLTTVIVYFIPLFPVPLSVTENLWVFPVILIPFIAVIAQSAFAKDEEETVTSISLFEDSETDLSRPMIIELPLKKEKSNESPAKSVAIQEPFQTSNTGGESSLARSNSVSIGVISDAESERDAVESLLEGLEKQSAEGKISPRTYQLLKQKYQSRLQDLDNRFGQQRSG